MSLCQLRPQPLQHRIGGIASEKLAIVPDIQSYSFVRDLQGCKRSRSNTSDCLSFVEEELDLLDSFQDTKHHCGYDISPSPEHFHLVESTNIEVFTPDLEVKQSYNFGAASTDISIFTCGGNSPLSTSSSPGINFTTATAAQTTAGCQQIVDFQDFFPDMQQRQPQVVMSLPGTHSEEYEMVITEQPEEVYYYCGNYALV